MDQFMFDANMSQIEWLKRNSSEKFAKEKNLRWISINQWNYLKYCYLKLKLLAKHFINMHY